MTLRYYTALSMAISVFFIGILYATQVHAAGTPEGLWQTIDDETGKPKSLVRISLQGRQLVGLVEEILTEPNGGR